MRAIARGPDAEANVPWAARTSQPDAAEGDPQLITYPVSAPPLGHVNRAGSGSDGDPDRPLPCCAERP
jgi:hypothetical protein